jgi:hypothetical protein
MCFRAGSENDNCSSRYEVGETRFENHNGKGYVFGARSENHNGKRYRPSIPYVKRSGKLNTTQ